MNNIEQKSKEFLASISKIKKLGHKNKKSKDFKSGMIMTMKCIQHDCLNHKNDEEYYGMKTSDLTKNLDITKPATSKILNSMEEEGFIERFSNKNDRRVVYVKLTEEGESFLTEQNMKFENFICKVVDKMGEEDTDKLISLFGKLYDVIEEIQLEQKD